MQKLHLIVLGSVAIYFKVVINNEVCENVCGSSWYHEFCNVTPKTVILQAHQARPSIIFFDELDGLAPVRSAKQDQIHASIVSTLLALMDGLDDRGEIVVIGATNRVDAIDPALRRPGRFDRELLFPLPANKVIK